MDEDGPALPTSAAADPVAKMAAMSMPTRPAEATATASAKIATRDGTAGEATGATGVTGVIGAIGATVVVTEARGSGIATVAPGPGETTATDAAAVLIGI